MAPCLYTPVVIKQFLTPPVPPTVVIKQFLTPPDGKLRNRA